MGRICCVDGCRTGYPSDRKERKERNQRIVTLFKPPNDLALFEEWKKAIPLARKDLTIKDAVCANHFKTEDVDTAFEVKLFGDEVYRCDREKAILKPGAVPCIFPIISSNSLPKKRAKNHHRKKSRRRKNNSQLTKEKESSEELLETSHSELEENSNDDSLQFMGKENTLNDEEFYHPNAQNSSSMQDSSSDETNSMLSCVEEHSIKIEPELPSDNSNSVVDDMVKNNHSKANTDGECDNVILPRSVIEEQFSYQFLRTNVNMVEILNSWWKVNVLDDFIAFVRWTSDGNIERKVLITSDLAVKVFLKNRETTIGKDLEEISIHVISKLIYRVERTSICSNVDKMDRNCAGFLQGVYICKKHNLCLNCISYNKELKKQATKRIRPPENHVELLRFNFNG